MKKKDLIYLLLAVGILLGAGYIGYTQLMPKKSASSNVVKVDKVGEIPAEMNAEGIAAINDPKQVVDFNSPVDLSGLNNQAPFGP